MEKFVLKENIGKIIGQRNRFLLFFFLQSIAVVILSLLLCFKKERTVIVPTSGPSFWIEERAVSSNYIERMGHYLADLLLNRSPADVEKKNQILLEHVHPSYFQGFKKLLRQEQEGIAKNEQSFFFRVENSSVDGKNLTFSVEGEGVVFIGKEGKEVVLSQKERKKYILAFRCENGKLLLTSLKKENV
jgi:conjugal transfer pilus assembly protein TraE